MSLADELRSRLARQERQKASAAVTPQDFDEFDMRYRPPADVAAPEPVIPERRYAAVAWVLAAGAVAVALILNWAAAPVVVGGSLNAGGIAGGSALGGSATANLKLPTQPSKMLPSDVIAYEVIDSHPIPGQEKTAAEAIYQTYNMNLTLAVAMTIYSHVQGYDTADEAQTALTELMAKYPLKRDTRLVGPVQTAEVGYTNDEGAYVVAWAKGRYVTYIKTFFLDHIPPQKRTFLKDNGEPVVLAVEEYERTGKQGAAGNVDIYKNAPKNSTKTPKPSNTPSIGPSGFGGEILGLP